MNLLACEELTERHRYNSCNSGSSSNRSIDIHTGDDDRDDQNRIVKAEDQETHHQTKKSKTDSSSSNNIANSSYANIGNASSHSNSGVDIILLESGGDNLAADLSRELADLTIYVIDTAGGDKIPRKGGPGE